MVINICALGMFNSEDYLYSNYGFIYLSSIGSTLALISCTSNPVISLIVLLARVRACWLTRDPKNREDFGWYSYIQCYP